MNAASTGRSLLLHTQRVVPGFSGGAGPTDASLYAAPPFALPPKGPQVGWQKIPSSPSKAMTAMGSGSTSVAGGNPHPHCGGDAHPELARLMMERREEALEEIRARNLGVRVTRNSVTEPTSGTIAHRIWEIIDRLRKPDGSVDRHNFLKRRTAKGGDQPGHSHGAQWSRWNRFHGMNGGTGGGSGAGFPQKSDIDPPEIRQKSDAIGVSGLGKPAQIAGPVLAS